MFSVWSCISLDLSLASVSILPAARVRADIYCAGQSLQPAPWLHMSATAGCYSLIHWSWPYQLPSNPLRWLLRFHPGAVPAATSCEWRCQMVPAQPSIDFMEAWKRPRPFLVPLLILWSSKSSTDRKDSNRNFCSLNYQDWQLKGRSLPGGGGIFQLLSQKPLEEAPFREFPNICEGKVLLGKF